jgi:hypothetical protein
MLIGFYAYVLYREKQRKKKLSVLFNLILCCSEKNENKFTHITTDYYLDFSLVMIFINYLSGKR